MNCETQRISPSGRSETDEPQREEGAPSSPPPSDEEEAGAEEEGNSLAERSFLATQSTSAGPSPWATPTRTKIPLPMEETTAPSTWR